MTAIKARPRITPRHSAISLRVRTGIQRWPRQRRRLRALRRRDGVVPRFAAGLDPLRRLRLLRRHRVERRCLRHPPAAARAIEMILIVAVLVFVVIPGLLLYGTLVPNAQLLGPVITCFEPDGQEVWLTIDDGPTDDTQEVLDVLRDVKATFFVKGTLARAHPERIAAIRERGHGVANHSDTHPSGAFWCLGPRAIAREIDG